MDRLSLYLAMLSWAAISGTLLIASMSLGWYNWLAIGGAALIGLVFAWPSAWVVSRHIKRNDATWQRRRPRPAEEPTVPLNPKGPEV